MAAADYINIPLNIKQLFLPFVLNQENAIFKNKVTPEAANGVEQIFSFKPSTIKTKDEENYNSESSGFLHIAPNSFYLIGKGIEMVKNDISYQSLYSYQSNDSEKNLNTAQFDFQNVLNMLPSVTIREYQQEAKINMLKDSIDFLWSILSDTIKTGFGIGKALADSNDFKNKLDEFAYQLTKKHLKKHQSKDASANTNTSVFIDQFIEAFKSLGKNVESKLVFLKNGGKIDNKIYDSIITIPYILYYHLITTLTTNVYEVPYNSATLYKSDGGKFSSSTFGGMSFDGSTTFGKLLNSVGNTMKIHINPTWDGPNDNPTQIELEFVLYNDSIDAALKHFIFINTILPNNKWIQYNIFQHAPSLYDVRINGVNRFFMCEGNFEVEKVGQLRVPPRAFFERLLKSHLNPNYEKEDNYFKFKKENLGNVIIPDQYKVKMTFKSVLPDNLNNYLFSYYFNNASVANIVEISEVSNLKEKLTNAFKTLTNSLQ